MGKGDRRTRKGKIFAGSYGNTRPRDESKASAGSKIVPKAKSAKK